MLATAGGLDGFGCKLRLDFFHLLLHPRSLFHQFSNAGHIVSRELIDSLIVFLATYFVKGL